jgi:hypothetical protein
MNAEKVFSDVSVYLTGCATVIASVSFRRLIYGAYAYVREKSSTSPNPFVGDFVVTPLSAPYLTQGGHHVFNLAYYSELTVVDASDRLCFHDPTQELGISLNFRSKKEFQACFDFLQSEVTVIAPALPGFFVIKSLHRPLSADPRLTQTLEKRRKELLREHTSACENPDALLARHSGLLADLTQTIGLISQARKPVITATSAAQVEAAFASREAMREFLLSSAVPEPSKWKVWLFMIGLYPDINESIREQYFSLKRQWQAITTAQFQRSRLVRSSLNDAIGFVRNHQQDILDIVPDRAIIDHARAVILSLVHLFRHLAAHLDVVFGLFKNLLALFVREVRATKDGPLFVNHGGGEFDGDTVEVILFWSLLYILEMGETRTLLQQPEDGFATGDLIGDFITTVHQSLARVIQSKGGYGHLRAAVVGHLANILPLDACIDTWLVAVASRHFGEFTQFMVISALFFNLPNLLHSSDSNVAGVVRTAFALIRPEYLQAASIVLIQRASDMIRAHLDGSK